jgi:hypothetical protein
MNTCTAYPDQDRGTVTSLPLFVGIENLPRNMHVKEQTVFGGRRWVPNRRCVVLDIVLP